MVLQRIMDLGTGKYICSYGIAEIRLLIMFMFMRRVRDTAAKHLLHSWCEFPNAAPS